jgi:hypothetical protein
MLAGVLTLVDLKRLGKRFRSSRVYNEIVQLRPWRGRAWITFGAKSYL